MSSQRLKKLEAPFLMVNYINNRNKGIQKVELSDKGGKREERKKPTGKKGPKI